MPRLSKAIYADKKFNMINRGNPREISNIVGFFKNNEEVPDS